MRKGDVTVDSCVSMSEKERERERVPLRGTPKVSLSLRYHFWMAKSVFLFQRK